MNGKLTLLLPFLFTAIGCNDPGKLEEMKQEAAKQKQDAESEAARLRTELQSLRSGNPINPPPVNVAEGVGSVAGRITFDGKAPQFRPLVNQGSNTKDADVCAVQDIPDERLIVGEDGGIANVFVYLPAPPLGHKAQIPPVKPLVFDRIRCRFLPHAMIVRVGQTVKLLNADPIASNVHTSPQTNKPFSVVLKANDRDGASLLYAKSEPKPVHVTCDFHNWVSAWQLPLEHSFGAVTNTKGQFRIENLPVGKQEFKVWHENAGFVEEKLIVEIVKDTEALDELQFAASTFK